MRWADLLCEDECGGSDAVYGVSPRILSYQDASKGVVSVFVTRGVQIRVCVYVSQKTVDFPFLLNVHLF